MISKAIKHNKKSIVGTLTNDDLQDHGSRLIHFYKKHGLEVELLGGYGKIKWVNDMHVK